MKQIRPFKNIVRYSVTSLGEIWLFGSFALGHFFTFSLSEQASKQSVLNKGILKGEVSPYHRPPVWFGISCMTTDIFYFCLQNRQIKTSKTGGLQYSDTSPFSIPWLKLF